MMRYHCCLLLMLLTACQQAPDDTTTTDEEPAYGTILVRQRNVPTVGLGIGEREARKRLQQGLKSGETYPPTAQRRLTSQQEAIAAAEPVLFATYGKENILTQRPYEVYLLDGYWFVRGTLPAVEGVVGGTFEIALAADNGRIVHLTHYE